MVLLVPCHGRAVGRICFDYWYCVSYPPCVWFSERHDLDQGRARDSRDSSHELFHFATDYAIAQTELMLQEPWWTPATRAIRSGVPNYCLVEEQLANAYMLKAFRSMKPALRLRGKQEALRRFTLLQPPGYRDGAKIGSRQWDAQPLLDSLKPTACILHVGNSTPQYGTQMLATTGLPSFRFGHV